MRSALEEDPSGSDEQGGLQRLRSDWPEETKEQPRNRGMFQTREEAVMIRWRSMPQRVWKYEPAYMTTDGFGLHD